jgi:hypothetical protein
MKKFAVDIFPDGEGGRNVWANMEGSIKSITCQPVGELPFFPISVASKSNVVTVGVRHSNHCLVIT